jgi:cytochrome c oxidase cbb3-type subunit I/II
MRPKTYEVETHQAPALSPHYVDAPAYSPLRESGAHVAKTAYLLEKLSTIQFHRRWERLPVLFSVWVGIAVVSATLFEAIPTFLVKSNVPTIETVEPYTPLEVLGRDIYVAEGCYNCHSQMVRPMRHETERYGEYSKPGEFVYDRPFQWGSRRIGPDLHRVGARYSHLWHVRHMEDPRSTTPQSIMPPYPHLLEREFEASKLPRRLQVLADLGAPYEEELEQGPQMARTQAETIAREIVEQGGPEGLADKKVVALIAYLQRLGTDIFKTPDVEEPAAKTPATQAATTQPARR